MTRLGQLRGVRRSERTDDHRAIPAADLERRLRCPVCQEVDLSPFVATTAKASTHIVLDACEHCQGLWFDRDEFAKIIAARRSSNPLDNLSTWEWLVDLAYFFTP